MLLETLRGFFTVNKDGDITWLYKFCLACIYPLQTRFDAFVISRDRSKIIAQCKWTIGQLTNTLNYLFDPTSKRITITQSVISIFSAPDLNQTATKFVPDFGLAATVFAPDWHAPLQRTDLIISIPTAIYTTEIDSVIEQIRLAGTTYSIVLT
jgi:hypothetical protein